MRAIRVCIEIRPYPVVERALPTGSHLYALFDEAPLCYGYDRWRYTRDEVELHSWDELSDGDYIIAVRRTDQAPPSAGPSQFSTLCYTQLVNILTYDQSILLAANSFFVGKNAVLDEIVKFCAAYLIYALPVILIVLWFIFPKQRKPLWISFIGGLLAWFFITKWIVPNLIWFRARPDLGIIGAKELLFHRPDYSFPSDHATMLFALVFGLYLFKWPKAANWFLLYAVVICVARVAIGVHFPLDILAGAISGFIGILIAKVFQKQIEKYTLNPVIWLTKKVGLR